MFQRLVALERSGRRTPAETRKRLMQIALAILAVIALGVIFGTEYQITHSIKQSAASNQGAAVTQTDLNSGVTIARQYVAAHAPALQVTSQLSGLNTDEQVVVFTPVSHAPTEIGYVVKSPGALILTSLVLSPPACLGVLEVLTSQSKPVFAAYPATSLLGTYYFETPVTSTDTCSPSLEEPPPGGQYVSTGGYPTAGLP